MTQKKLTVTLTDLSLNSQVDVRVQIKLFRDDILSNGNKVIDPEYTLEGLTNSSGVVEFDPADGRGLEPSANFSPGSIYQAVVGDNKPVYFTMPDSDSNLGTLLSEGGS